MKSKSPTNAVEAAEATPGRGRDADSPTGIPREGLLDVAVRMKNGVAQDNLVLVAAGVAFYSLLAIFPAITALMSVAGMLYQPDEVVSVLQGAAAIVPPDVSRILLDQAKSVAGSNESGLTLGIVLGLTLAMWSASTGVASLVQGLNVAYDEKETRSFVWLRLRLLGLTIAIILGLIVAVVLIVAVPIALSFMVVNPRVELLVKLVSYVPLALIFVGGVSALYRWGPDRERAKWRWLTPGAIFASVLWLVASIGFSFYVQNFGSYNQTFGSIAGVIVLLMWLWISALVVLLGAELNAELEAQTARDSTTGTREPLGHRGAQKADELGHVR